MKTLHVERSIERSHRTLHQTLHGTFHRYIREASNSNPTIVLFHTTGQDDDVLNAFAEYARRYASL